MVLAVQYLGALYHPTQQDAPGWEVVQPLLGTDYLGSLSKFAVKKYGENELRRRLGCPWHNTAWRVNQQVKTRSGQIDVKVSCGCAVLQSESNH